MHVTVMHDTLWHSTNTCHTMAWYQCMSHMACMVPMHITLWDGTNACHTMVPMHVTLQNSASISTREWYVSALFIRTTVINYGMDHCILLWHDITTITTLWYHY